MSSCSAWAVTSWNRLWWNRGRRCKSVNELRRADLVLTTKTHYRRGSQLVRIAEANGKPVYVLRKNSLPQLQDFLRTVVAQRNPNGQFRGGRAPAAGPQDTPNIERAMQEAEDAANRVLSGEEMTVKLSPQHSHIRRLQHMLGPALQRRVHQPGPRTRPGGDVLPGVNAVGYEIPFPIEREGCRGAKSPAPDTASNCALLSIRITAL